MLFINQNSSLFEGKLPSLVRIGVQRTGPFQGKQAPPLQRLAVASTMGLLWRKIPLLRALQFNGAGNGVNFHASAAIAHVRSQRVFTLLFNHDGNLRTNLSGDGAGG